MAGVRSCFGTRVAVSAAVRAGLRNRLYLTRLGPGPARTGAGCGSCARTRAGACRGGSSELSRQLTARRTGGDVPRAARRGAGDDREVALAAREGDRRLRRPAVGELSSQEIAAWRMALSPGYRFDATQALRQVLAPRRGLGMIDINPAKVGVDNPRRGVGSSAHSSHGRSSTRSPGGCSPLPADDDLRSGDRAPPGGMDRARETRHRPCRRASSMSAVRSRRARAASSRRPRRADERCRSKPERSTPLNGYVLMANLCCLSG